MADNARSYAPLLIVLLALVGIGGGAAFALWPEPEAPAEVEKDPEADPTRDETENQMREIGYVQ